MPDFVAEPWRFLDFGAGAYTLSLGAVDAPGDYPTLTAAQRLRFIPMGPKVRGLILRPFANAQDTTVAYHLSGVEDVLLHGGGRACSIHTIGAGNINTSGGLEGDDDLLPAGYYYGQTLTFTAAVAANGPHVTRVTSWATPSIAVHSPGTGGTDFRGEIHVPDALGLDGLLLSWNNATNAVGWMYRLLT